MTDLSPDARELLRGAREDWDASVDDRDRVHRALAVRLGVAGAAGGAATVVAPASAARPASVAVDAGAAGAVATGLGASAGASGTVLAVAVKWVGISLVGFAVRERRRRTVYWSVQEGPARSRAMVAAAPTPDIAAAGVDAPMARPRTREPTPVRATPAAGSATLPAPPSASVRPAAEHANAPLAAVDAFEGAVGAETRLLRRADEELRHGNAAAALALLDEHARTFPHGVLSEERSAERVTTLCALGRVAEARVEAQRFLTSAADSPLAKTVRTSCGAPGDREPPPHVP